jgi:hypothetical protein
MYNYGSALSTLGLNAMNTQMLLGTMPSATSQSTGRRIAAQSAGVAPTTRFAYQPNATEDTIAKMAAAYPVEQRTNVAKTFRGLLQGYSKIESQFDIPMHDLAGAVAAFIAGSYMAYNDVDFPDDKFKPLVQQVRQAIAANPEFARASAMEKQATYEQMAILGTFLATTQMALKERPNQRVASDMREAAKGYLEQFLKTDADKVEITSQGLVIR